VSGETNSLKLCVKAKATSPQVMRGGVLIAPEVTHARPEASRSSPGQGEVSKQGDGGLKRFYVQVTF